METIVIEKPKIEEIVICEPNNMPPRERKTQKRQLKGSKKEFRTVTIRIHSGVQYGPPEKMRDQLRMSHITKNEPDYYGFFLIMNLGDGLKYAAISEIDGEFCCFEPQQHISRPGIYHFMKPNFEIPDKICGGIKIFRVKIIDSAGM